MQRYAVILVAASSVIAAPRLSTPTATDLDMLVSALATERERDQRSDEDILGEGPVAQLETESYEGDEQDPKTSTPYQTKSSTSIIAPAAASINSITSIQAARIPTTTTRTNSTATLTTTSQSATHTHKSLIPHWSYEKSCIAAASIFSTVAIVAIIFLTVVYIRRLKRAWTRYKTEKRNRKPSTYRIIPASEDSLSKLSQSPSSENRRCASQMSFTRDDDKDAMLHPLKHTHTPDNDHRLIARDVSERTKASPVNLATLEREYDPHLMSSRRREPLAKQIVVVRPAVVAAVPMSVRPSSVTEGPVAAHNPHILGSAAGREEKRSDGSDSIQSGKSRKFIRLPSIKKSEPSFWTFTNG